MKWNCRFIRPGIHNAYRELVFFDIARANERNIGSETLNCCCEFCLQGGRKQRSIIIFGLQHKAVLIESHPFKEFDIAKVVSLIDGSPAYGDNDVIDVSNHPVWDIKRTRQLDIEITFALGVSSSKPAININFAYQVSYINIGAPKGLYENER